MIVNLPTHTDKYFRAHYRFVFYFSYETDFKLFSTNLNDSYICSINFIPLLKLHLGSLWTEAAAAVSGTEPAAPSFTSQPQKTTRR